MAGTPSFLLSNFYFPKFHPFEVSFHTPKGGGVDFRSGHIPQLRVQSLVGAHVGGNQFTFLLCINVSLPPLSLKSMEIYLQVWIFIKKITKTTAHRRKLQSGNTSPEKTRGNISGSSKAQREPIKKINKKTKPANPGAGGDSDSQSYVIRSKCPLFKKKKKTTTRYSKQEKSMFH